MKSLLSLAFAMLFGICTYAQSPEKISYQAIVRDANGILLINKPIGVQISILQGSVFGTPVYTETHNVSTNDNGLASMILGIGLVSVGDFSSIDWSDGPYFIKTETDPDGGSNYSIVGTSQLMSVPYALHATTADSIAGGVTINESDPVFMNSIAGSITALDTANWNNQSGGSSIDSAGIAAFGYVAGPHTVDTQIDSAGIAGYGFVANALTSEIDGSVTNEIQDLQLVGNILTITNNGAATTIDLSAYLDDTQIDSAGISALGFITSNQAVDSTQISNYGFITSSQAIDSTQISNYGFLTTEIDGSVTNEIQDLQLVGNILTITNNGSATTIDLSAYLDDTDTQIDSAGISALGFITSNQAIDSTQISNYGFITNIQALDSTQISNYGFITSEVDGSVTNEIQDLQLVGNILTITNNGSATTIDLSAYLDDTQIDSAGISALGFITSNQAVDSTQISNYGFITSSQAIDSTQISNYGFLTSEIDGSVTNEIQDLQLVGNILTITNNGAATTIDLSAYLDDTQIDSAGISALGFITSNQAVDSTQISNYGFITSSQAINSTQISNYGFLTTEIDGSVTNEIQDLQLVGNILTITNNGAATTIDLSAYLDDTQIDSAGISALGFITSNQAVDSTQISNYGFITSSQAIDSTQISNYGFLTTEIDGSVTNEIQDLQLVGNILTITNNGAATTIDLSAYLDDTDTQLTESQVDSYVSNNGYITSEIDGSVTNEIQDLQLVGNNLTITNNGSATTIDLSAYLDDTDTQLTESQVDSYVSNNGYITSEIDGSVTNEIQDLQLVGNNLTITNNGSATTIDLSVYLDDTDTQLTESQVDSYVSNNGYITSEVDGSVTNEIQDLQLSGNNLTITNNGSATTIDLSVYLDDTDTQLTESQVDSYVSNNGYITSEVDGSVTNEIELPTGGFNGQVLQTDGSGNYAWVNQASTSGILKYVGQLRCAPLTTGITQSIPNATTTSINWGSVNENYAGSLGGTDSSVVTIPTGVNYIRIITNIMYSSASPTTGEKSDFIVSYNGSPFSLSNNGYGTYQYFNAEYGFHFSSGLIYVTPGSTLEIQVRQTSGSAFGIAWGSIGSNLMVEYYSY